MLVHIELEQMAVSAELGLESFGFAKKITESWYQSLKLCRTYCFLATSGHVYLPIEEQPYCQCHSSQINEHNNSNYYNAVDRLRKDTTQLEYTIKYSVLAESAFTILECRSVLCRDIVKLQFLVLIMYIYFLRLHYVCYVADTGQLRFLRMCALHSCSP